MQSSAPGNHGNISKDQTRTLASLQVSCLAVVPAAEARPPLTVEEEATIGVFRRNTPSVVYITNLANRSALPSPGEVPSMESKTTIPYKA